MRVTIAHAINRHPGWSPIMHMVDMLGHCAGTKPIALPERRTGRLTRILNRRAPQPSGSGEMLIAVLTSGTDLIELRRSELFRRGYDRVAVWIVDSFRTEHIGRWDSFAGIDVLAISQRYDTAFYAERHRGDLVVLPYGADVLAQPDLSERREYDVARFGRQPAGWEDDATTGRDCAALGLTFHGRPPFSDDPDCNRNNVHALLRNAKCALAFSNLVSQETYTHGTKPFFSARWADALACGAAVAGVPPLGDTAFGDLLWDSALIDLGSTDRTDGLRAIARYCADWTPELARINQAQAMLRLDWRWRFQMLFDRLGFDSPVLNDQLSELEHRAEQVLRGAPGRPAGALRPVQTERHKVAQSG